jgi:hypothetical protein
MRKRTFSEHLHELRYHMIAGAIWYLIGLLTWGGITTTFASLSSNFGRPTTVVIDVAAAIVIFGVVVYLVRLWAAANVVEQPPKKLRKVQVHRETGGEGVFYRLKVRIAIKNETGQAIHIRKAVWIANGEVALELPPRLKLQIEKEKGVYSKDQWVDEEFYDLNVDPDFAFRTWIGLHQALSDKDFGRAQENEQFGTLSLALDGYDGDLQIPV